MFPTRLKHILTSSVKKFRKIHSFPNISPENVKESIGKQTQVQGWVRALRKMKDTIFLDINDGSTSQHLQVVMSKKLKPDNLNYGCSVSIFGEIAYSNGKIEIIADKVDVIGTSDINDYPFLPRKHYEQEYIRQYLHLRPRTRQFSSIIRLRDVATTAINDHMKKRGFFHVHTPIITSNDCEGAGEVFNIVPNSVELIDSMKKEDNSKREEVYFDTKAFLTVSGQFHLEVLARALSRVYTFGPTFRAENSKSRLHLSEFYMIEAEMAFLDNIEDLANEAEVLVKSVTASLFEKGAADLASISTPLPQWLDKKFGIFSYDEAFDILERHADKIVVNVNRGQALTKEQELFLVEFNGGIPVFIVNWPKSIKPFYMKECEDDDSKVSAMDLLAPQVGELFGGSLREDNYEKLKSKLPPKADINWYLELREHGNVPTGGYGMGFERFLQAVLGVANIKDVIPFPRWPHNCSL